MSKNRVNANQNSSLPIVDNQREGKRLSCLAELRIKRHAMERSRHTVMQVRLGDGYCSTLEPPEAYPIKCRHLQLCAVEECELRSARGEGSR